MRPTRLASVSLVLGAALTASSWDIPPLYFEVRTVVVESADSTPVFGDHFTIRFLEEELSVRWDQLSRQYSSPEETPNQEDRALRVARLKGEVYLFQDTTSDKKYVLVPVRIAKTGDMSPLSCEPTQDMAAEYGVSVLRERDEFGVELKGDRPGIIGFMAALVDGCKPLLQLSTLRVPESELAAAGAAPGRRYPSNCVLCPAGEAACIQGAVADALGQARPEVLVTIVPDSPTGEDTSTYTNHSGQFFAQGIPEGRYELRLSQPGFISVELMQPFYVRPGFTYFFEDPFALEVAIVEETVFVPQEPVECRGSSQRSPR